MHALCRVIDKHHSEWDVNSLFTFVGQTVSEASLFDHQNTLQMPVFESSLTSKFFKTFLNLANNKLPKTPAVALTRSNEKHF